MIESPRGYRAREFSVDDFRAKVEKQRFEREYSADDIWANYTYFIKAVLPVAEKADVRLALHPDDPPLPMMNGVAKLFVHYDGYKRADEIAGGSKHWGLTFCVGTWSEGGDKMGKDVFGMIQDFGARGKIFGVHFRNVSSPLPRFHETFHDDGYLDMYQVMKALRQARCTASLIPDHYPGSGGRHEPTSYRGLQHRLYAGAAAAGERRSRLDSLHRFPTSLTSYSRSDTFHHEVLHGYPISACPCDRLRPRRVGTNRTCRHPWYCHRRIGVSDSRRHRHDHQRWNR